MLFARVIFRSAFLAQIVFAGVPRRRVHFNQRNLVNDVEAPSSPQKKEPSRQSPANSPFASWVLCGSKHRVYYVTKEENPCNDENRRPHCQCSIDKCGEEYCAQGQLCATCTIVENGSPSDDSFSRCNQVNNPSTSYCKGDDDQLSCHCKKLAYNAFPNNELAYDETTGLGSQSIPNSNVPSNDGIVSTKVALGDVDGGDTKDSYEIASGDVDNGDINAFYDALEES